MRQRRAAARYGMVMSAVFAALLLVHAPALSAAQVEPSAQDESVPESPEADAEGAGTGAVPTLNKARLLALDVLAAKAARYPDNPYILNEYGNQLLRRGRPTEAVATYARAVKLSPNFVQAWNNLGLAYQAQQKLGSAKRAYKKAIKLAPNFANVHYNLGTAYEASGSYDKMIRSYKRALELDPSLSLLQHNPQIGSNKHLSAVLLQMYVDRGGSVYYPVLSAYPNGK